MYINRLIKSVIAFAFITAALSFAPFLTPDSFSQECQILIAKDAEEGGGVPFAYQVFLDGAETFLFEVEGGDAGGGPFTTVTVRELPKSGWTLDHVECEGEGMTFVIADDGFSADCVSPQEEPGVCTFFNLRTTANIPTLSEWGMIAATVGLGLVGVFFAIRRRRVNA
jgi:hypothetical protein